MKPSKLKRFFSNPDIAFGFFLGNMAANVIWVLMKVFS